MQLKEEKKITQKGIRKQLMAALDMSVLCTHSRLYKILEQCIDVKVEIMCLL